MERVVHTIVAVVEVVSITVVVSVVPVVVTHRAIKMGALHSVEDICSGIVLVGTHVIMVVTIRAIINAVALVPPVVPEHAEIALERVLAVVLVPPKQVELNSFN